MEGKIYIYSDNLLAPDGITRISGCKPLDHDLHRDRKVLDPHGDIEAAQERRRGRVIQIPPGKNWCSCHEHEGYDEHGHDDGGWRPNEEFTEYIEVRGKRRKHEHCKACRARHARKLYAAAREAAGQPVRMYKRQLVQMTVGG